MASVQLAGLQAQLDMMSFKKQDSFGTDDPDSGSPGTSGTSASGSKHHHHQQQQQDEASIKGLWRRAFNILKTKEKDKVSRTSKKKKTARDEEETLPDVDPVYSLLKRASDKGVQKCCSGPGTSTRSSDASLLNMSPGLRRESLMSTLSGSPVSSATSWARRKATMNAFRLKSISVDHAAIAANSAANAAAATAAVMAASSAAAPARGLTPAGSLVLPSLTAPLAAAAAITTTVALVSAEPAAAAADTASLEMPVSVETIGEEALTINDAAVHKVMRDKRQPCPGRPMLSSRKKSVSVDSPDQTVSQVNCLKLLDDEAKRKSSSFTNTNLIESQAPPNPQRRKQLAFGRNKSFSAEQDNTLTRRLHADLVDDSAAISKRSASPRHSPSSQAPIRCSGSAKLSSPRRGGDISGSGGVGGSGGDGSPQKDQEMTRQQIGKRRMQWKMKSFSLDNPDHAAKDNLEVNRVTGACENARGASVSLAHQPSPPFSNQAKSNTRWLTNDNAANSAGYSAAPDSQQSPSQVETSVAREQPPRNRKIVGLFLIEKKLTRML